MDGLRSTLPDHGWTWRETTDGGTLTQQAPGDADLDASSVVVGRLLSEAGMPIRSVQRGRSLEESFFEASDPS